MTTRWSECLTSARRDDSNRGRRLWPCGGLGAATVPNRECRVKLWMLGVRGSTAAPGYDFVRYGGHTSCVALVPDGSAYPTLVLDAGTGLRTLTDKLDGQPFRGAIVVSHLHWDHVQGLPFFAAGDRDDSVVELYLPAQDGRSGRDLLAGEMSPPSFPIEPEGLKGSWTFHAFEAETRTIAGFEVTSAEVMHKGGRTFGYRVEHGGRSIAYIPDHAPAAGCADEVRNLIAGVDVLVHDAQFLEAERTIADLYGHATVDDAIALAVAAGTTSLVLFHHSPVRSDDQLDAIAARVARVAGSMSIVVARQGDIIDTGALPARS